MSHIKQKLAQSLITLGSYREIYEEANCLAMAETIEQIENELRSLLDHDLIRDIKDANPSFVRIVDENNNLLPIDIIEANVIERAIIISSKSNYKEIAEKLNIARSTFYRRLKQHNLDYKKDRKIA